MSDRDPRALHHMYQEQNGEYEEELEIEDTIPVTGDEKESTEDEPAELNEGVNGQNCEDAGQRHNLR